MVSQDGGQKKKDGGQKKELSRMAKTVLPFLMEGVEEIEFVTTVDIWRRAGFVVTVVSLGY